MDRLAKRKLIQKVRNRMSAQRSRMRKGIHYKIIEQENLSLRAELGRASQITSQLQNENLLLARENLELQNRIKSLETSGCAKWYERGSSNRQFRGR